MTFDPATITAEKSLWAIWSAGKRIRRNLFNQIVLALTIVAAGVYSIVSRQSPHELADLVRSLANVGLGFSAQILGFLVAGFTIFATLSKPSLFANMARIPHPESNLSYLKYSFFVFFETFGWYLGFTGYCILVLVIGSPGGALTQLLDALPPPYDVYAKHLISRGATFIVATWLVVLVLELKSFIYNLYQVIMTSILWTIEFPDKESTQCGYQADVQREQSSAHETSSVASAAR